MKAKHLRPGRLRRLTRRRSIGRISTFLLMFVLLSMVISPVWSLTQYSSQRLLVSRFPDRAEAVALAGQSLSGPIYVFVPSRRTITEVAFRLDGSLHSLESSRPFDFNGTAIDGSARPWSPTAGEHTITVKVTLKDGEVRTLSATFSALVQLSTTTTITSAPTTTTLPAPTTAVPTTAVPTTAVPTTAAPTTAAPTCAPVTIMTGGNYSGCYQSTSTGTPAVTLATSQPVTLDHARVIAKGFGIQDTVTGTRLTVINTIFQQTNPGAVVAHRAMELQQPASFVAEHNRFADGDGIWIGGGNVNPLTVRYNQAINIGRYPHPTSVNCCVQFLQLDSVTTPAGEIAWNHIQNMSGESGVDDNINLFKSGGSDSAHKVDIHHNLVDGAYPLSSSNTTFAGGGVMASDGTGSFGHTNVHDNTVVATTNYGVGAAGGTDVHLFNNVLVNDTLGSDGSTHYYSNFGQAISIHDLTASDATKASYNWRRDPTANQFSCWISSFCTGNTQISMTEQQARDAWAASVPTGVRPIGPP